MTTTVLHALARVGGPARELAVRLDLVRGTGLGYARRRRREQARLDQAGAGLRGGVYEAIWRQAAEEVGATVERISPEVLHLQAGERWTRVWHHETDLDGAAALRLVLDKPLVHRMLVEAGLPVPAHAEFSPADPAPAVDFLHAHDGPCVVKPAAGTGAGEGVTGGVRTPADLARAALRASRGGARLLVEAQGRGDMYRLLLLDGELIDAVRRHPPHLVGDGRSTLADLMATENERRLAARGDLGLFVLRADLDCLLALREAGTSLGSVPAAGERVRVKSVNSQNAAEENETVPRGELGDDLVDVATRAARLLGLRLAGVDVVTPDAAKPLDEVDGMVLEVNGTPGLHYHYQVADTANATRVAVPVLRALLGSRP